MLEVKAGRRLERACPVTLIASSGHRVWEWIVVAAWLRDVPASAVVELPRPAEPADREEPDPDPDRSRRLAALVAAFHRDAREPLLLLWRRSVRGGPVRIITAGTSVLPPAARVRSLEAGELLKGLAPLTSWTPLRLTHDGLLDAESESSGPAGAGRPALETSLLSVWQEPFAVLLVAEPIVPSTIEEVVWEVVDKTRRAKQLAEGNPDRAVEYERLKGWHRELRTADSLGLWRVRLLAGGADPAASGTVAGLLCASADLSGLTYSLRPGHAGTDLDAALDDAGSLAGTQAVAALARPPSREVPGIRLTLPSTFDVTPEVGAAAGSDGFVLGAVLDTQRRPSGPLPLSRPSLNRHTFVCGATGAGKSQTVRHLLEEATRQGVPWLVIEPAKAEYRRMSARGADVVVIRPGDPGLVAAGIDPLRPAPGFPLQTHLDLVRALFLAAFEADEPFPQVLSSALKRVYEEQGWDVALGEARNEGRKPRYPTLGDLERAALDVVAEVGYGREVADNIRGFVKVRLSSLRLGTTGRFLEGGYPLDIGRLLKSNVVLEIEDVGDDRDKAFLIGTMLIALTEHLRVAERRAEHATAELRHLTVVEEAHRLLRRTDRGGSAAQAVEMFAALLAEIRAYGEGLVIAEQIPAKLIPDVIKNTAVKVVHRLPAKDDREAVGATMNITDAQSAYLVTLPPGEAAVFSDGMDYPVLTRMPDGTETESVAPADVAGPDSLVTPTFGRCAAYHGAELAVQGDVLRARRELDETRLLRLWVELNVVAHLAGRERLRPSEDLMQEAYAIDRRLWRLVVMCAVDDAVATRSVSIKRFADPARLSQHMQGKLLTMLDGGEPCLVAEPDFLAPAWRWVETPTDIKGFRLKSIDTPLHMGLMYGNIRPSVIEDCIGYDREDPSWRAGVLQAMRELTSEDWPILFLHKYSVPEENERGGEAL